ncbi:A24 family peptidase [uncultured Corynebacterium sp.]|uniref:A24 family peptidase n=1 Tax=uncultured Corynebacterium sp. TaxID=159447 RepID=UPI0025DD33F2|nr:A24 family peptidase [uncultured Corynebacterium sp.]
MVTAWAVALCVCDMRWRRLPDWLTLPAAIAALPWLSLPGLVWPGLYLVLTLVGTCLGRQKLRVGGGDIKLAVPLGVAVAAAAGVWGALGAVALANALTLLYAATWRDPAGRRPPHGPFMLAAAAVVVAW